MKPLLLILALAFCVSAQDTKDWKLIKEMSGDIPDHPGLTVEVRAAQIARGDDGIKVMIRADFPWGSPDDLFRDRVPHGLDPTSISRIEGQIKLNCATRVVTPVAGSADVYQFNGKKYKSREPPFSAKSWNVAFLYFCEDGTTPIKAPTLKPKP